MPRSGAPSACSLSRQSSRDSFLHRGDLEYIRSGGSLCAPPAVSSDDKAGADGEKYKGLRSYSVRVVVRFRPPMSLEDSSESRSRRTGSGEELAFVADTVNNVVESTDLQHRFHFDRVFSQVTQSALYEDVGRPIVADVLQGYHGTILAYGQTGSGKTYSMFGPSGQHPPDLQGLVPRAAQQVFAHMAAGFGTTENLGEGAGPELGSNAPVYTVECNFLEVYCEQMRDLLKPGNNRLQVKELPQGGLCVDGLTHKVVNDTNEVLQVIRTGLKQRAAAYTRLNQHSSRSHAIFTLHVWQRAPDGTERHGKLTLVDLAGSEKVHKSGSAGEMLEEAKKINSSLSALGNVIDALADQRPHVPYRDSRLTRILEDSLGGNCRTTLIVGCSPNMQHAPETLSSLRFAGRAKKVRNIVYMNVTYAADRQLLNRIAQLRRELAKAHGELERRFDWHAESGFASQSRSPSRRHRPLLKSLTEDARLDHEELPGEASVGRQSSVENGAQQAKHPRNHDGFVVENDTERIAMHEGSDAASTAIGSGSSSAAPQFRSSSATPISSHRDTCSYDDDMITRKLSWIVEATPLASPHDPHKQHSQSARPWRQREASARGTPQSASKAQSIPVGGHGSAGLDDDQGDHDGEAQDDIDRENQNDLQVQQDLHWSLELERHRCAALSFELDQRTRESEELRRQLKRTESLRTVSPVATVASARALPVAAIVPIIAAPILTNVASMPAISEAPIIASPIAQEVSIGAVTRRHTARTPSTGSRQGRTLASSCRTPSASPMRVKRYLRRTGSALPAAWLSPRRRSSSQLLSSPQSVEVPPGMSPSPSAGPGISPSSLTARPSTPDHSTSRRHLGAGGGQSPKGSSITARLATGSPLLGGGSVQASPPASGKRSSADLRGDLHRWVDSVL